MKKYTACVITKSTVQLFHITAENEKEAERLVTARRLRSRA